MKTVRTLTIAAVSTLLASCGNPAKVQPSAEELRTIISDETTTVNTAYGKIRGYKDGSVYTFKGIPYAKAERFMPPQEPDKHEGVKVCRIYGPKAPQTSTTLKWAGDKESDYAFGNNFVLEPMDEEHCLVLNVWTKGLNDGKKRPVFVWFHGGGYASGSGHDLPCYEGRALAEKGDIVFVNVNHRLNVLGYLDLSGLGGKYARSANLGQQDLVKSLEWIQKNIAAFGGDPTQVTIGGQSGGGGKVSTVMAMPPAQGLFHRAIVQSGSMTGLAVNEHKELLAQAFIKELGVKMSDLDKLNDFTYEELIDAANRATRKANEELRAQGKSGRVGMGPVVDGQTVVGPTFNPEAPEVSRSVPMLIGTDLNEFSFNNVEMTEAEVKEALTKRFGDEKKALEFMEAYRQAYPGAPLYDMVNTDLGFRKGAVSQATSKNRQGGADVYLYLFTWKPSVNALGASHGMELPFMSNNIMLQREMTGGTADAYQLADIISSAWLSFIKTGNPNTPGLPTWEAFTEENGATMILDNECKLVKHHDKALLEFQAPGRFR